MTPPIRMVPVDPTEDAYTLAAGLAPDLFSDDYETAHRAASPYDVTIKRRHKAEEVQTVIDLYRAMLTAAPVREEGGALKLGESDLFEVADIIRTARGVKHVGSKDYAVADEIVCFVNNHPRNSAAALATREEAPAEAGEDFRAQVVKLLDELIAHIVAIGPDKPDLNTPMLRRVWREVFADLIDALRAQPQAREEAQPVADAVEPIELAIAALKGHISAIQVAKRGGGSSSLITDCINSLPEIVRWVEGGLFNVEAAFEQYEATPPAPEAEKLRASDGDVWSAAGCPEETFTDAAAAFAAAIEWIEEGQKERPERLHRTRNLPDVWAIMLNGEMSLFDTEAEALAALQAEQKGGA